MTDNKYYALGCVFLTLSIAIIFEYCWDTDGFYLQQGLLVLAGYLASVIINAIKSME